MTLPLCGKTFLWYAPAGADRKRVAYTRFPPNTRGFLYYYTPPKAPPLVGELRFRLANDLDGFHDGEDLLSVNKAPWSIPLYALANRSSRFILRDKLLIDDLVSQATLDKWAKVGKFPSHHSGYSAGLSRPVLYYLCQPFYHRFNATVTRFYAVTREEINRCVMFNHFRDEIFPYGGELLSLLFSSYNSHNFFFLRRKWFGAI